MTRDEAQKIASDSGLDCVLLEHPATWPLMERAFALVAQAEREAVAAWILSKGYATGHGDTTADLLNQLEWQIVEREREACAKVCSQTNEDGEGPDCWDWHSKDYAAAIRCRTNAAD